MQFTSEDPKVWKAVAEAEKALCVLAEILKSTDKFGFDNDQAPWFRVAETFTKMSGISLCLREPLYKRNDKGMGTRELAEWEIKQEFLGSNYDYFGDKPKAS